MFRLKVAISLITFVSLCLLLFLLNTTTPATAGPFGILIIFTLVYLLSFGMIVFFIHSMSRLAVHLSTVFMTRRPIRVLKFKKVCLFSSIIAAAIVMLIGLRSVGEVGFYECTLVILFVMISGLYVSKRVY